MNTEATQDNSAVNSTGQCLRAAREKMGLTQQNVAERLCLKLSIVRDLEEDKSPVDLASTFLRGYIRSYARLVHVPEEELLPMMAKQAPVRAAKVELIQSFSLGKRRKKRDGWLMIFTWLVLFVVIGLTGAWWWQNHKAAQNDLASMAGQNSVTSDNNSQSIPLSDSNSSDSSSSDSSSADRSSADDTAAQNTSVGVSPAAPALVASAPSASAVSPATPAPITDANPPVTVSPGPPPTGAADVSETAVDANPLAMNFNKDCWLEVTDAKGKKLFSGMQRSGGQLSLAGTAPYHLKIGAPGAVEIQYQGQSVDLSRFIRSNQVARLTVGAR